MNLIVVVVAIYRTWDGWDFLLGEVSSEVKKIYIGSSIKRTFFLNKNCILCLHKWQLFDVSLTDYVVIPLSITRMILSCSNKSWGQSLNLTHRTGMTYQNQVD